MIVIANTGPIALSIVEGCAQSPHFNVLRKYASARPVLSEWKDRFFARLAAEIFLSSLQPTFVESKFLRGEEKVDGENQIGAC
jgi:hypothetical protein